jgi:endonuclease YncB( thermonuclease family)
VALLCLLVALPAFARKPKAKRERHDAFGFITLNGERVEVRWTDGDSFKIKEGARKGLGTRLTGYNTLEAYGPVHQWGEWTAQELFELAKRSSQVAAAREWTCSTDGKLDGYKRLLVHCEGLAEEMVRSGHALAYAVDSEKVDPAVLAAQAEAMKARRGMWEKGTTFGVITSLHAVGEDGDEKDTEAYNRVVDTRTGKALKRKHTQRYATCETVCESTDGQQSCMVYVPFRQRYGKQPGCLRIQP